MGRYYHTQNHEGKFGFGVQPSDDPAYFGMEEQEPTSITYYIDDDDKQHVKDLIDKNYDILGVPKDERVYTNDDSLHDLLHKHALHNYHSHTSSDPADAMRVYIDDTHHNMVPNNDDIMLAESRVVLGATIYDDLEKDGYCELEAEL